MKTEVINILGSTGSIGTQTLEVCKERNIKVNGICANNNIELLEKQAREFNVKFCHINNKDLLSDLKVRLSDTDIKVTGGEENLSEFAVSGNADTLLTSVVGSVGLAPTVAGLKNKMKIALANKETLVAAGEIVMDLAMKHNAHILPVDSEHSAIFQCLMGSAGASIEKIHLTASGGPFLTWTREEIAKATKAQALNHPNWSMGSKITIDSATMMNKGLEIIEARWLFGTPGEKIQVVIHPESIIHSMVEYADGSVIAQMGHPDMREAIQFAFSYPFRLPLDNRKLNFAELGNMSFFAPDQDKFPALKLAYEALEKGGNMACIMNAANEAAVAAFLKEQIGFYDITDIVQECMNGAEFVKKPDLETIFKTNETVLAKASEIIERISGRKSF